MGPRDGKPGDADKGCCFCAPSLLPSYSTSYIGSGSKDRMCLNYCLGGDEIAKSMHKPSRPSPVLWRREPELCPRRDRPHLPILLPPSLPLPGSTALRRRCCHLPQQRRAHPRLLGPLPPPPRRIRGSALPLEPSCRPLFRRANVRRAQALRTATSPPSLPYGHRDSGYRQAGTAQRQATKARRLPQHKSPLFK